MTTSKLNDTELIERILARLSCNLRRYQADQFEFVVPLLQAGQADKIWSFFADWICEEAKVGIQNPDSLEAISRVQTLYREIQNGGAVTQESWEEALGACDDAAAAAGDDSDRFALWTAANAGEEGGKLTIWSMAQTLQDALKLAELRATRNQGTSDDRVKAKVECLEKLREKLTELVGINA